MPLSLSAAQSLAKYQEGAIALSQGQLQRALKDFSISISYSPNAEAYLAQAEVLFAIGQPRQAYEKIQWVENRMPIFPNCDKLYEQVEQLKAKHSDQTIRTDTERAIDQELRLVIPVSAAATKDIYMRLTDPASLNSTDGITLINKRTQGCTYGLAVSNREPGLIDMMLACGQGRLPFNHVKAIKEHTHLIHLSGPHPAYAPRIKTQIELASDMLETAAILAQELGSSAVYVATAGMTHTTESFGNMNAVHDPHALLSAFVQRVMGKGTFYTCGMHALGYADVQLDGNLPPQDAAKLVFEFLQFSLFKNLRNEVARFPYKSAELLKDFDCQLGESMFFDPRDPFYNQNGIWTLRHIY